MKQSKICFQPALKTTNKENLQQNKSFSKFIKNTNYEEITSIYHKFFSYNLYDNRKTNLMSNFNHYCYWFLMNLLYFPHWIEKMISNNKELDLLYEKFNHLINQIKSNPSKAKILSDFSSMNKFKIKQNYKEDGQIEDLIKKFEHCEKKVKIKNGQLMEILINKIKTQKKFNQEKKLNLTKNENMPNEVILLLDIDLTCKEKEEYDKFLHKKHEQYLNNIKASRKIEIGDDACEICNDGDFEAENMKNYCIKCDLIVHTNCYGVKKNENDDWICNVCKIYKNNSKNTIRCVICPVLGGAMKQCELNKKSKYYNDITKNLAFLPSSNDNNDTQEQSCSENEYANFNHKNLFPQKFVLNTSNKDKEKEKEEEIEYEKQKCWIHLSCALWNFEVDIKNFDMKKEIKNFEFIDKQKYMESCNICGLSFAGICVKCKIVNCVERFHVECARKKNYYFEVINNNRILEYSIYCLTHMQNKLTRIIYVKKKRACDEIKSFGLLLNKFINNIQKENNSENILHKKRIINDKKTDIINSNTGRKRLLRKRFREIKLKDPSNNDIFLEKFKYICRLYCSYKRIYLKKGKNKTYKVLNRINYFKNVLDYKSLLKNFNNLPWYLINIDNLSIDNLKELFYKLIIDEFAYNKFIKQLSNNKCGVHNDNNLPEIEDEKKIKSGSKDSKDKITNESSDIDETIPINNKFINIETNENGDPILIDDYNEDNKLYCYCKQKYKINDIMICKYTLI